MGRRNEKHLFCEGPHEHTTAAPWGPAQMVFGVGARPQRCSVKQAGKLQLVFLARTVFSQRSREQLGCVKQSFAGGSLTRQLQKRQLGGC